MKKRFFNIAFTLLISFGSFAAFGQYEEGAYTSPAPKWAPAKGYWVVETNVKTPKTATLYFYNNANLLVYKEEVEGIRINVKKRRTKMQLKQILDESLALYEERKRSGENEMLAKNIIAGK